MPNKKNIFAETVAEWLLDQRGPVDSSLKEMGIGAISAAAGIGNAAVGIGTAGRKRLKAATDRAWNKKIAAGTAITGPGSAASKLLRKSIIKKAPKKKAKPKYGVGNAASIKKATKKKVKPKYGYGAKSNKPRYGYGAQ